MNSGESDPPEDPEDTGTADEALAATKAALLAFLRTERPKDIFYLGQLEVMFEDRRFLKTPWGMRGPFHCLGGHPKPATDGHLKTGHHG